MRCLSQMMLGVVLFAVVGPVTADEPPTAALKPTSAKTAEVKTLIQQLMSGKYKERNEATQKLMSSGKAAIEPVAQAAKTADLELGARCVDILKHYYENGDAAEKTAARTALTALLTGKHASVARWASDALRQRRVGGVRNPVVGRNGIIINRVGRIGGRRAIGFKREAKAVDKGRTIHITETIMPGNRQIVVKVTEKIKGKEKTTEYKATSSADLRRKNKEIYDLYRKHIPSARPQVIGANNVRIAVAGVRAGRNVRVSSSTVNGVRRMTITENNRRILIRDKMGKEIAMSIREVVNGKQKTTQVTAKDLDDLKKKSTGAAKIYQRYATGANNAVRGRFGRAGAAPRVAPRGARRVPVRPPQQRPPQNNRGNGRKEIEKAKGQLTAVIAKLRKLATSGKADSKDLRKLADEIKAAKQELDRATKSLQP